MIEQRKRPRKKEEYIQFLRGPMTSTVRRVNSNNPKRLQIGRFLSS